MTDEYRKLCDALRNTHPSRMMCREAADVIERLAARADASAGLIEAAEWHEEQALRFAASPHTSDKMRGMMHKEDAHKLRARAAEE